MSGIPVKNHGKKNHKVLLKKRKQICVKKAEINETFLTS